MNEALLQFIWQWSLYRPEDLRLTTGEVVTVIQSGLLNRDAGPDFLNARIHVGETLMAGNVELHIRSSEWIAHGHQHDPAYGNVILHVVLHHDASTLPSGIPVLELDGHIPESVLNLYQNLVLPPRALPCAPYLPQVADITRESQLSRMLAERWEQRRQAWQATLDEYRGDWARLLYQRICGTLGHRANTDAFEALAKAVPLQVLQRHHARLADLEALLFGAAGFLNAQPQDDYTDQLRTNWLFLNKKYTLEPMLPHAWKFLRMRPANFPTIRIAQLAALLHGLHGEVGVLLEAESLKALEEKLSIAASPYWDTHYRFGEQSKSATTKRLGRSEAQLLVINTLAPVQFLSRMAQGSVAAADAARDLMEAVPAEDNNIVQVFKEVGWKPLHAAHSQAMLQLFRHYCEPRRCLECSVGLSILRARPVE